MKQAGVQTVARQRPAPGSRAGAVTIWANPVCVRSALSGPPPGEPIVRAGPTRLVSGLFLRGGPAVLFSSRHCAFRPAKSWAGTITVTASGGRVPLASMTVAAGALARLDLPPGDYTIAGTFANAFANGQPMQTQPTSVTVTSGNTVRQDVVVDVP